MDNTLGKANNSDLLKYLLIMGILGAALGVFSSTMKINYQFLGGSNEIFYDLIPPLNDLLFFGIILVLFGLIGTTMMKKRMVSILTLYFGFLIAQHLIFRYGDISITYEIAIIRILIIAIPFVIIYSFYSKSQKMSIVLLILTLLNVIFDISMIVINVPVRDYIIDNITADTAFLNEILDSINLIIIITDFIVSLALIYFFYMILKQRDLQLQVGDYQSANQIERKEDLSIYSNQDTTYEIQFGIKQIHPLNVPVLGQRYGIIMMKSFCKTCGIEYKPNLKLLPNTEPIKCSKCSNNLVFYYVQQDLDRYYKFLAGIVFFAGAISTTTIMNELNLYGANAILVLLIIAIIEFVIGFSLLISATKNKITKPPSYASQIFTPAPNNIVINEMLIVVVMGLIGGFILWLINNIIMDILL